MAGGMSGLFFTFDGIDGTGKSTQLQRFGDWLAELGHDVVACRDPGSTRLGEALREIVLRGEMPIDARSETLIYMAARAQLVEEIIRPAMLAGKTVVSDRFLLANVVYQAYGLSLDPDDVWSLGEFATGGLHPTKTFLLDMDVETAGQRIDANADRLEQRDVEYHIRVREGFLTEAARNPQQICVIDANQSIDDVHQAIRAAADDFLVQES